MGNELARPDGFDRSFLNSLGGKVRAEQAGTYTFFTLSDDAVRLFLNGQLLISNWVVHALTENSNAITLGAGQSYDLTMEYFNASVSVMRR